jgi:hypothetical protein
MIDLHTHSTASDGSCTPERLVALAGEAGLTALALTDHDTLGGIDRARAAAAGTGLLLVAGVEIEIATDQAGGSPPVGSGTAEFHLLGLGLSAGRAGLEAALAEVRLSRAQRNGRMVARFQAAGMPVSMEELSGLAGGEVISRAHFARLLVRNGIASSVDGAFSRFIGRGKPFYEPRACLPLVEACRLIREAGGVPVIAHPLSLGLRGPALRQYIATCRDAGVAGIEAWHPTHSLKECRMLARLARGLGMPVTGGSDFHGEHMPQRKLGRTGGGREVPDEMLAAIGLRAPGS